MKIIHDYLAFSLLSHVIVQKTCPLFQPISFTAKTYHNLASCVYRNFLLAPSDIFLAIIGYCDCFSFGFKTQLKCALT